MVTVTVCALVMVGAPLLLIAADELTTNLGALQFWPQILSALSCGLGLAALARHDPTGAADICFGAALAAATVSVMAVLQQEGPLLLVTRSPIHLALLITAGTTASVLLRATLTGQTKRTRTFSLGMTGALPLMGFLGTIFGIMSALQSLPALFEDSGAPNQEALNTLLFGLASAFETTMIGLIAAVIAGIFVTLLDTRDAENA